MSCSKCGQADIADGGIGCVCGACKKCNGLSADKSGYCFLCRPCKVCGRSVEMHVKCKMCDNKKTDKEIVEDLNKIIKIK